uniref:CSON003648 protein n=1 Tax=Culicoides sonorensis TaxID=179676 RepID=A0A336L5R6_CULSO
MFIENFRDDFYNLLIGKRILLIVNYDLDAICASKILLSLFKFDNMLYSLIPVMGMSGMIRAYNEHRNDVKSVLMINCGGGIDLVEVLQPDDDVVFYVCDSHRPYNICNIYSNGQVQLIGTPTDEDGIPEFEQIFQESDMESNSDTDGSDLSDHEGETRMERIERRAIKRREKRQWEAKRDEVMFQYTQYNYYGRSSALMIFELAWKLSKDSMDLLWWAIVGATEQLILGKIESTNYTLESDKIQGHCSRLMNRTGDQTLHTSVKILYENDLHLALYRHWTVIDSLRHSMYPACKLKLWTAKGDKRMNELLVEMGLPLVQARQSFSSMDLTLRKEFYKMLEGLTDKYGMPDIIYGSFTLQYGYRNRFAAADYVFSMIALLESITKEKSPEQCFLETMDSLNRTSKSLLEDGINKSKQMLSVIMKQVQSCLDMHLVKSAGPFLYYILQEENAYFSCPYGITMLAKFVLRAHVAVSKNRRAIHLPLVLSSVIDAEQGHCLMVGVTPVSLDARNLFGRAFEEAANKCRITISQDSFEQSIIQIKQSDQTKFLDALTVVLS